MIARALSHTALLALVLGGCSWGGGTTPGETNDAPIPSGTKEECDDTPPIVQEVRIEDGGMREYEQDWFPSIVIDADTTDADGDLHYYEMQVWWDLDADGHVEPEGVPLEVFGTLSDTECSVDEVTLGMVLMLSGGDPPYHTEVEFGVRVLDDRTNISNNGTLVTAPFVTPDAEGNYP